MLQFEAPWPRLSRLLDMIADASRRCPPLRVLHLITDLDVGGAEMMLVRLVSAADRARVAHTVVSLTAGGSLARELTARGVEVDTLSMRPDRPGPGAIVRLIRMLRRVRPHVLQTWLYHADFLGLMASALGRQPALVWNIRCAELTAASSSRAFPFLVRALARGAERPAVVICNSHAGRRVHEHLGYRPRRWEIIPNGLDTGVFAPNVETGARFRRDIGVECNAPLVGLVARLHPMKDHRTFLRAAAIVAREHPDARFLAVGRGVGTSAPLREIADELHLQDRRREYPRHGSAMCGIAGFLPLDVGRLPRGCCRGAVPGGPRLPQAIAGVRPFAGLLRRSVVPAGVHGDGGQGGQGGARSLSPERSVGPLCLAPSN